jgi:hypothetical protein
MSVVNGATFAAVAKALPCSKPGIIDWARVSNDQIAYAATQCGLSAPADIAEMAGALTRTRDERALEARAPKVEKVESKKEKAAPLTDAEVCLAAGLSASAFLGLPAEAQKILRVGATKSAKKAVTFKVGEKGGISVYGLNVRFPITLYINQWERLIENIEALKAFMLENKSNPKLARRDD